MNLLSESKLRSVLAMSVIALACACSDTTPKAETETHFLRSCESSCAGGLQCICGVCTEACTDDGACDELAGTASCAATPDACNGAVASACDVTCTDVDDCAALGGDLRCVAGRCRADDTGESGAGGAGDGGAGASGGQSGAGAGGDGGGAGGGTDDAAIDGGSFDAGSDASASAPCDSVGDACCDPFPQDGPNFCDDLELKCGANNTCELNCECPLPAYIPVCGVDGQTYNTACGTACVPVAIACNEECPCGGTFCTYGCTGAAPDQEVIDACEAITDPSSCSSHVTGGIPSTCRWVTPSSEPCPAFP